MSDFDPWADDEGPTLGSAGASSSSPARAEVPRAVHGRVLTVCTGNVCRSPYLERMLAHVLTGTGIEVESAGTGALVGHAVDAGSARLLDAAGVSGEGFAARQIDAGIILGADLVLTATRDHRRAVVQMAPAALGRTFAVVDFADLVTGLDASTLIAPGANPVERVVRAAAARRGVVHARPNDADVDIVDPYRRGPDVFDRMQRQCDPAIRTIGETMRRAAGV